MKRGRSLVLVVMVSVNGVHTVHAAGSSRTNRLGAAVDRNRFTIPR